MSSYQTTRFAFRQVSVAPVHQLEAIAALADSLSETYPKLHVSAVLVNAQAEDRSCFDAQSGVHSVATAFGCSDAEHEFQTSFAVRQALFGAEHGEHRLVLINSLDELYRSLTRRFTSPLSRLEALFQMAGPTAAGGSLTVIGLVNRAALSDPAMKQLLSWANICQLRQERVQATFCPVNAVAA